MTPTAALDSPPVADAGAGPARASCDWRFLLPIDERSRVLDLTGDAAVARAISADAREVLSGVDPGESNFDVILLHDAWDAEALPGAAAIAQLRTLRARLRHGGSLWLAGSRNGPGAGAWEWRLSRAGFTVTRRFALFPDAKHAVGIRPLDHEIARAFAARLPGTPSGPVLDLVRRVARPLAWAGRLVPSFGLLAHAAAVRR